MRHLPRCWPLIALPFLVLSSGCTTTPGDDDDDDASGPVDIDLSTYPDSGDAVDSGTVLADQWRGIGVLFDGSPEHIDPVMDNFGGDTAHLFFSPDEHGATAVISFVDPGTDTPVDISGFSLVPWFNPDESAELVGLDADGNQVAADEVTADDIGDDNASLEQSISGTFRTVQWRTHGNPGIAANTLIFEP